MAPKSARKSGVDPLLDRKLVCSAEGALPVHSRVAVNLTKEGWQQGIVTSTWSTLEGVMYKILWDHSGKEQQCDLSLIHI